MKIFIVESENDEFFVRALITEMQQTAAKVYAIEEFKHSNLSETALKTQISSALIDLRSINGAMLGIILDIDEAAQQDRLDLVNRCIQKAFYENFERDIDTILSQTNQLYPLRIDEYTTVQVACHFTNVDGKGELETVLKSIKTQDSTFADCLECWQKCFEQRNKKLAAKGEQGDITDKEMLKLWVDFYKRFDTMKKGKRNELNTDWKGIWLGETAPNKRGATRQVEARGTTIFDLNHTVLNDLKNFIRLFEQ